MVLINKLSPKYPYDLRTPLNTQNNIPQRLIISGKNTATNNIANHMTKISLPLSGTINPSF